MTANGQDLLTTFANMRFSGTRWALLALVAVERFSLAAPIHDELQQSLGITLGVGKSNGPYTPDHHDPYDRKVDSYGEDLQPLPYRNGDGATIQGPRNKDRERENPDLMRPPSTDHGDVANMRYGLYSSLCCSRPSTVLTSRKMELCRQSRPYRSKFD